MPKKKLKKTSPVALAELTALIVAVVDAYLAKKDGGKPPVPPVKYHVQPHCDGCTCPPESPHGFPTCCQR